MFPKKMPGEDFIHSWYPILFALACGLLYAIRSYFKGPPCPSKNMMKDKTVVVTGANSGIGREIARDLAERGATVIMACRSEERCKEAVDYICQVAKMKPDRLIFMKLDLDSFKSIREFAKEFSDKYEKIDVLVNNAGVISHPQGKTEDGFEINFQSSYLGHFLLVHLLLDKLRAAPSARIITITALAYRLAKMNIEDINYDERDFKAGEAYAVSKLAVVLYTRQLAKELEGSNLTVNVVHPGVVNSPGLKHMPFKQSKFLTYTMGPLFWFLTKSSRDGAQTPIYCAVAKEEEKVNGKYYKDCRMTEIEEPGNDDEVAQKLWDVSLKMTGIKKY